MASFPGSLYSLGSIPALMSTAPTHSTILAQFRDEIIALETTIGVNPQGASASLDARLDLLDAGAQTWTPSWTNLSVGNGTQNAGYLRVGKVVFCWLDLTFGTTTSVSGIVSLAIPSGSVTSNTFLSGGFRMTDASAAVTLAGQVRVANASTINPFTYSVSGTDVRISSINATVPFTWTSTDSLALSTWYVSVT